MTTSARPTSDAVSPAAGQPGSGQGNSPGRVQLPPPGRVRQGLALLLVLLSFGLLWRYSGRHSGSIEWGYRIIYGAPAFAGFVLLRVRRLRWAVGAILCACITISYLDRNTMGLAVTAIRDSGDIPSAMATSRTWCPPSCSPTPSCTWAAASSWMCWAPAVASCWSPSSVLRGHQPWLCRRDRRAADLARAARIGEGGGFPGITKAVAGVPRARALHRHGPDQWRHRDRRHGGAAARRGRAQLSVLAGSLPAATHFPWRWCFPLRLARLRVVRLVVLALPPGRNASPAYRRRAGGAPGDHRGERRQRRPVHPVAAAVHVPRVWGLMLCKFLGDASGTSSPTGCPST